MTRSTIGIRINEACASNQSLNSDNAGEFDDWVELYNTTGNSILLSNCFLTDDPSNWNRWQLPDTLLPAHGFVLLWLDDDLEQGRQHANFKLNAAEELLLYRWEDGKPRIVDRASGFSPVANQTWSLITDGASESTLTTGTPGYSNNSNHAENHHLLEPALFPCPASYTFFWPQQNTGQLWDAQGVLLMDEILPGLNSCAHLAAGVYFIKNDQLTYRLLIAR
jgi:hypothetical protein